MDRGELFPENFPVDDFLDKAFKFSINHISINQNIVDSIFTLEAFCRASSAKLQDFNQDINIELEASKKFIVEEDQALERMLLTY